MAMLTSEPLPVGSVVAMELNPPGPGPGRFPAVAGPLSVVFRDPTPDLGCTQRARKSSTRCLVICSLKPCLVLADDLGRAAFMLASSLRYARGSQSRPSKEGAGPGRPSLVHAAT